MLASSYIEWLERQARKHPRLAFFHRSNLWLYQHLKLFLEMCMGFFHGHSSKVRLFCYHSYPNFGDALNADVMRHFQVDFSYSTISGANALCIGSLLEEVLVTKARTIKYDSPVHVFGTGFMMPQEDANERLNRPVVFHALRGKLTLGRCEQMVNHPLSDVAIGDPGLLVKHFFPDIKHNPTYDVGIILHSRDINSPVLQNLHFKDKSVKFIDILLPTREFAKAVSECRLVLSSAMHGLICADSLNIPNRWLVVSGKVEGGGYKFRDYYSAFSSSERTPLNLAVTPLYDADVERLVGEYQDVSTEVDAICEGLAKALSKLKNLSIA